jgi:excisionase family DNA binding protein
MAHEQNITPRCLSRKQAASYLGISEPTFKRMEKAGNIPKPIKIGLRRVVWDKADLDNFINQLRGKND